MAKPVRIRTNASIEEAAALFQHAMRVSWISENVLGQGTVFEEPPASVFDSLESDRPHFSVMAILGGGGDEIQKSAVYLHAWDRGEYREIILTVGKNIGALGVKAKMKIRRFMTALQGSDPA